MLALTRNQGSSIILSSPCLDKDIEIMVSEVRPDIRRVKLGIIAPKSVNIRRNEVPDERPEQGELPEVWCKADREQAMQAAGPRARAYIEKLENIAQLADDFWTKLNRRAMSPEEHQLSEALLDALSVVNFLAENDEAYLDEEADELPRDVIFS